MSVLLWPPHFPAALAFAIVLAKPCSALLAAQSSTTGGGIYAHHGADWASDDCASRARQSPVNINDRKTEPTGTVQYHYERGNDTALSIAASSGSLTVDVDSGKLGGVYYEGGFFPLKRIILHGPSEHLINGVRRPLEIQLVHGNSTTPGQSLIVSLLVERQPGSALLQDDGAAAIGAPDGNAALQDFFVSDASLPEKEGSTVKLGGHLDLAGLLHSSQSSQEEFFLYAGSLSAPPCTEGVTWLVRRAPLQASAVQVGTFALALWRLTNGAGSFREVMPLGTRSEPSVVLLRPVQPPPASVPETGIRPTSQRLPLGPRPRTDGELQAEHMAKAALREAQAAGEMAKELLRGTRESEEAYLAALNHQPVSSAGFFQRLPEAPQVWEATTPGTLHTRSSSSKRSRVVQGLH